MAGIMRALGRLAGHTMKTKAYETAAKYIATEMKLADLRIKIKLLKQKKQRHLLILGRTSYRLAVNGFNITNNLQIDVLIRVIVQTDTEIDYFIQELLKRKEKAKAAK